MDTFEAKRFGEQIRHRRQELGLSTHDLGKLIGTRNSTIMRIEQGAFAAPRPDKLARIAQALHLSLADIYADAGYMVPDELPSFHAYLPARYRDLPQAAIDELSGLFDDLIARHGLGTPAAIEIAIDGELSGLETNSSMIGVGGVSV